MSERTAPPTSAEVVFDEVDRGRWPDLVRLFEGRGGPKHCWCMVWRDKPGAYNDLGMKRGEWAKAALGERVDDGVPVGMLGYVDGEPVAWCSVAPRPTYRRLGGADLPGEDPERVWAIVCFYVQRRYRHMGIVGRAIEAAAGLAKARGATAVEAYPVDPDAPSYRFMGFLSSFERAGFREVGRAGTRRHVYRLGL